MGKTLMVDVRDLPDTSFFCAESLEGLKFVKSNPDKTRLFLVFTDHLQAKDALFAIKKHFERVYVKFMHYKVFFRREDIQGLPYDKDYAHGALKDSFRTYVQENTDGHMVYPPLLFSYTSDEGKLVFTGSGVITVDTYDSMQKLVGELANPNKETTFSPWSDPKKKHHAAPAAAAAADVAEEATEDADGFVPARQRNRKHNRSGKRPKGQHQHQSGKHLQIQGQLLQIQGQLQQIIHGQILEPQQHQSAPRRTKKRFSGSRRSKHVRAPAAPDATDAPEVPPTSTIADYISAEQAKEQQELTKTVMAAAHEATKEARAKEPKSEWAARLTESASADDSAAADDGTGVDSTSA